MTDTLSAALIRDLLIELGARLDARGIEANIFIVGGAAMALAFNRSRVTRVIDAVFEPKTEIYTVAAQIAEERNLPADWLNDSVKGLLPNRRQPAAGGHFDTPGLKVAIASAEYMFAMKAAAARQVTDREDLALLARALRITSVDQALQTIDRYYGPGRLTMKTQLIVEDVVSATCSPPPNPGQPGPNQTI